jgi:putative ABC transport system permease protein
MALPILSYNLKSLAARWQVTLLAVSGVGVVVAVFVILQAMAAGFAETLKATGRTDGAIVVQKGAQAEPASIFPREQADALAAGAGVARADDGTPLASPEVVVVVTLPGPGDAAAPVNATVRGVTPVASRVRGGITILAGRAPAQGAPELMVGQRLSRRLGGLGPGGTVRLQGRDWRVAGVFAADGGAFESELWAPLDVVSQDFQRQGMVTTLALRLAGADALPALERAIAADPRLRLEARREDRFYEAQSGAVTTPLRALAAFVVVVMGLGAVFAAMNTMNAVIAARVREVATLRALGFGRLSILAGFLVESVALGFAGGIVGCLLALPMNGFTGATGNTAGFAEIAWAFRVTLPGLGAGVAAAVLIGAVGGLLPAVRAARTPLSAALRTT